MAIKIFGLDTIHSLNGYGNGDVGQILSVAILDGQRSQVELMVCAFAVILHCGKLISAIS